MSTLYGLDVHCSQKSKGKAKPKPPAAETRVNEPTIGELQSFLIHSVIILPFNALPHIEKPKTIKMIPTDLWNPSECFH